MNYYTIYQGSIILNGLITFFVLWGFIPGSNIFASQNVTSLNEVTKIQSAADSIKILYNLIDPEGKINYKAFKMAYSGYNFLKNKLNPKNSHILTIIDYSKPSVKKRLFVLDVKNNIQKLL